jgi:hypothetical protein
VCLITIPTGSLRWDAWRSTRRTTRDRSDRGVAIALVRQATSDGQGRWPPARYELRDQRAHLRWRHNGVSWRHMSAIGFDIRQPAVVARALGEANSRLSKERETPASVVGLVEDVAGAIAAGDEVEAALVNPWLWIKLQSAAIRAQSAIREEDPDRRRQLRLALEQMRFLFARIADREPIGEDRAPRDVALWLDSKLASVSQPRKAALLHVSPRTYQRWVSDRETAHPSSEDERRLRIVARIVNQLRHSLTGPGVVEWFAHPRTDLEGATPSDVLDDPEKLEPLIAAAAASRGNVAA